MNNSRVGGVLFLILSVLYGYYANDIPLDFWSEQEAFNARSMPRIIAGAGIVTSILLIMLPSGRTDWTLMSRQHWLPTAALLVLMSIYGLILEPLGFALSTTLFLCAAFGVLGERNPVRMLAVSIPMALGFWLLMDSLGIYLGPGTVFEDLLASRGSN
jgi:putative tricarboxylic transport membrane protein